MSATGLKSPCTILRSLILDVGWRVTKSGFHPASLGRVRALRSTRNLSLRSVSLSKHSRLADEAGGRRRGVRAQADIIDPAATDVAAAALEAIILDQGELAERKAPPGVAETKHWQWKGYKIRYQEAGDEGPALVLIHGFGANSDHWRKNIGPLSETHHVFAIDLLGYGDSDKPDPRTQPPNTLYSFETWAQQTVDFCREVVEAPAFLICNSVGGVVGLQAACTTPSEVLGVLLLNISLRQLHLKKQSWLARPFIRAFQAVLRSTALGSMFFASVAKPAAVKGILTKCYGDAQAVTDELVECILQPGLQPGATEVFLDFISYSGGPLPEELLPQVQCPVLIAWGAADPWEPIALGRAYGEFPVVEQFVELPGVGHCPQDEAPHLINPLISDFVARHTAAPVSI